MGQERIKMPRRNAAHTLRACRYRNPSRQPIRLCCSDCHTHRSSSNPYTSGRNSCRPYRGNRGSRGGTSYDDLYMQARTCLRAPTQKPMLLSQVSWSFSLDVFVPNSPLMFCSKPSRDFFQPTVANGQATPFDNRVRSVGWRSRPRFHRTTPRLFPHRWAFCPG